MSNKKRKTMSELPTTHSQQQPIPLRAKVPVLTVSIPYLDCEYDPDDYSTQTRRFDAGRLSREDWNTIHAIRNGFSVRGDTDKDGRRAGTPIAAFRMLLESVRESIRKTEITELG